MKRYWMGGSLFIVLLLILISTFPKVDKGDAIESNLFLPDQPYTVITIGSLTLPDIEHTDWETPLPDHARFIVAHGREDFNLSKIEQMESWIKEKRVVLFYGMPLAPDSLFSRMGWNLTPVTLDSTEEFHFALYGYGYSFEHEKEMPLFLGYNQTDSEESLKSAVSQFLLSKLNF